ncbi:MAG: CHAT domain-containing protein [Acidobacteriota bacterium]
MSHGGGPNSGGPDGRRWAAAAVLMFAVASAGAARDTTCYRVAEAPVEGHLERGEQLRLRLCEGSHQAFRLVVEQDGADVSVTLRTAAGEALLASNLLAARTGREEITLPALEAGFEIAIQNVGFTDTAGRIRLTSEFVPPEIVDHHRSLEALLESSAESITSRDPQRLRAALEHLPAIARDLAAAGRPFLQAQARYEEARIHRLLGDTEQAIRAFRESHQIFDRLGYQVLAAHSRLNLSSALHSQGLFDEARRNLAALLPIYRELDDLPGHGAILISLASIEEQLGRPEVALTWSRRAILLAERDRVGYLRAAAHRNHGLLLRNLGDFSAAFAALRQAAETEREIGWIDGEAESLAGIGSTFLRLGEAPRALAPLRQALKLAKQQQNRRVQLWALRDLGEALADAGRPGEALAALARARDLGQKREDRHQAEILLRLGIAQRQLGEIPQARQQFVAARQLFAHLGLRNGVSRVLLELADLAHETGDLEAGHALVEEAIASLDTLRQRLVRPDLRRTFAASQARAYELRVALRMALHDRDPEADWDRRAFLGHEAALARGLRESLAASRGGDWEDLAQGPRAEALRSATRELESVGDRRRRAIVDGSSADEVAALEIELAEALQGYRDRRAELRQSEPRLTALEQPPALTIAALQEQVLDPNTELVEIALGENRSYLWRIDRESFSSHLLPGRAELEAQALRLHQLLRRSHQRGVEAQAEIALGELGRQLFGTLDRPFTQPRLVVVADGALAFIPFGLLAAPAQPGDSQPLQTDHQVVYAPSAGVLRELRRRQPAGSLESLAIIADPVYSASDPRVGPSVSSNQAAAQPDQPKSNLARLPHSRREAETIAALVPMSQRLTAFDFDASLETIRGDRLAAFDILHFATHARIDAHHPELSGLALSQVDPQGVPQEGFLRSHHIAELDLGADLVVLSACRTALGPRLRREGLISLTRAFIHAGASQVVVSLWDVGDEATAELMARFYRALLEDRLDAPAALRQAQLELSRQTRWRAPFYWAGFVVQGGGAWEGESAAVTQTAR